MTSSAKASVVKIIFQDFLYLKHTQRHNLCCLTWRIKFSQIQSQ